MLGDLLQDLFIGRMPLVILLIELMEFVDDLSFLESSVSDGCQDCVPLPESVFFQDTSLYSGLRRSERTYPLDLQ